ncbi:uncharacterized protein PRCAT00001409001 [Priceomyces carsonii]|uniref:uncharacterized protein n=1 Tax=Priceomyces carsonii TaxID=28549 RepID=UPI002ED8F4D2|nr:unnamed protein product [Priceomyces carsonii]
MKVIIIGGGIGGLALAQGLKSNGIAFHIFERDSNLKERQQGYRLRISSNGRQALRRLLNQSSWNLLLDTSAQLDDIGFWKISAIEGNEEEGKLVRPDKVNSELEKEKSLKVDREIFRNVVLMNGISSDEITFGKEFLNYTRLPDGQIQCFFKDNSSVTANFLIGADGGKSKVAAQYLPIEKIDTGIRAIYGKTMFYSSFQAALNPKLNQKMSISTEVQGDGTKLVLFSEPVYFNKLNLIKHHCSTDDYLYWVFLSKVKTFDSAFGEGFNQSNSLFGEALLKLTGRWMPDLRSVLEHQVRNDTGLMKVSSVDPQKLRNLRWQPSQIVLLGDAIHLMSPASGSGANLALEDASHILDAFIHGKNDIDAVIDKIGVYESKMREYASQTIAINSEVGAKMFGQEKFTLDV